MGQVIAFPTPTRRVVPFVPAVRPTPPRPDLGEVVADLLIALERMPGRAPLALALRPLFGPVHVAVRIGSQIWRLWPDEARTAVAALRAENAYVGWRAQAQALADAARDADAMILSRGRGGHA